MRQVTFCTWFVERDGSQAFALLFQAAIQRTGQREAFEILTECVFLRHANGAVQLKAFLPDVPRRHYHTGARGGAEALGMRGIALLRIVLCFRSSEGQCARLLDLDVKIDHSMLNHLIGGDGPIELLACLEVLQRQIECPLHGAHGFGAMCDGGAVQCPLQVRQRICCGAD